MADVKWLIEIRQIEFGRVLQDWFEAMYWVGDDINQYLVGKLMRYKNDQGYELQKICIKKATYLKVAYCVSLRLLK